jgi:hypothetical protein
MTERFKGRNRPRKEELPFSPVEAETALFVRINSCPLGKAGS